MALELALSIFSLGLDVSTNSATRMQAMVPVIITFTY